MSRSLVCVHATAVALALLIAPFAYADELWIAPTVQRDVGGIGVAKGVWPVSESGAVRLALSVPGNLQAFQGARLALVGDSDVVGVLDVVVCRAQDNDALTNCAGPFPHNVNVIGNLLREIDISAAVGPSIVNPGDDHLAIYAAMRNQVNRIHIVGMRFTYTPTAPAGAASLGANTFTGTQTAPAFVGDGSGLTNLPVPPNVASLGANLFTGTQVAPAFVGDGSGLTNLPRPALVASLGTNTFTGPQTAPFFIGDGSGLSNLPGQIFDSNGNVFLGFAGSSEASGDSLTGVGIRALGANTTGFRNTALGLEALFENRSGARNVGVGDRTLTRNVSGSSNTALGAHALGSTSSGDNNVAIGERAGSLLLAGSNNIYLGTHVEGEPNESNAIYLGRQGLHAKAVIGGIRGTTVTAGEMVVIDPSGRLGSTPLGSSGPNSVGTNEVIDESLTAADLAPNSVGSSELVPGSVTAAKVSFPYAGSAAPGGVATNAELLDGLDSTAFAAAGHGHDVTQVLGAARLTGTNTFSGTQTIVGGNLVLSEVPGDGRIMKGVETFLHSPRLDSVFLGLNAGNVLMTGSSNTGMGTRALGQNTDGTDNTAVGSLALAVNASGNENTGIGTFALSSNLSGNGNAALGWAALTVNDSGDFNTALGAGTMNRNTTGSRNTALGHRALESNIGGSNNIAIGYQAGVNVGAAESDNVFLASAGESGDNFTVRLGQHLVHQRAFIAGVRGVTAGADAIPVVIDSNGQLGTISSSIRFKEDVRDMGDASHRLFQLRPVSFRYSRPSAGGEKPIQYGLVAEEVAAVFPELAVRSANGQIETVHYEKLSALLLNELQRQERQLQLVLERLAALESRASAR